MSSSSEELVINFFLLTVVIGVFLTGVDGATFVFVEGCLCGVMGFDL